MNENITIVFHGGGWIMQRTVGAVPREGDTIYYDNKTFSVRGPALFDFDTNEIHVYMIVCGEQRK